MHHHLHGAEEKEMKRSRKAAVRNADKWFSLYVRELTRCAYGVCPFCGGPIEHCFHFFSRVSYSTRWDIENSIGSCSGCNMKMEYQPYEFYKWYAEKHGQEQLDRLNKKWHTISKLTTQDIEDIAQTYKEKYEGLKGSRS